MKFHSFYLSLAAVAIAGSWALAQTVDTGKLDTEHEGTTTIQIKKSKNDEAPLATHKTKWETQDGSADIEGEASATGKDAKKAWQKACDVWKKEIREDNKENKILNVSCGISSCSGEAGSKVCSSKASYKVKTKSEE
jgi:hypothetical protein